MFNCDLNSAQKLGVTKSHQQCSYTTQHSLFTSLTKFLWCQIFLNASFVYTDTHTHTSALSNFNLAAIYTEAIFLIIRPATFCENTRGSVTPAGASITFPLSSFPLQLHSPIAIVLPSAIVCFSVASKHFTQWFTGSGQVQHQSDWGRFENMIMAGQTLEQLWELFVRTTLRP